MAHPSTIRGGMVLVGIVGLTLAAGRGHVVFGAFVAAVLGIAWAQSTGPGPDAPAPGGAVRAAARAVRDAALLVATGLIFAVVLTALLLATWQGLTRREPTLAVIAAALALAGVLGVGLIRLLRRLDPGPGGGPTGETTGDAPAGPPGPPAGPDQY